MRRLCRIVRLLLLASAAAIVLPFFAGDAPALSASAASPTAAGSVPAGITERLANGAQPAAPEPTTPPWLPTAGTLLLLVVGALFVNRGLRGNTVTGQPWSLADAVSEESTITENAQNKTVMAASTSRLIALFGMLVILSLYLGVGIVALWDLASSGKTPSGLNVALKFMLGGASLFAPYLVNQVRAAVASISK
jgi:hypothetical protein